MLTIKVKGNTDKTEAFLRRNKKIQLRHLDKYGEMGVEALAAATPIRTGLTAESWEYEIKEGRGTIRIIWKNTNIQNGNMIVALLVYGHATTYGTYIEGDDFVTPALTPILKQIADDAFLEVTK
jgi:hypothetical protein